MDITASEIAEVEAMKPENSGAIAIGAVNGLVILKTQSDSASVVLSMPADAAERIADLLVTNAAHARSQTNGKTEPTSSKANEPSAHEETARLQAALTKANLDLIEAENAAGIADSIALARKTDVGAAKLYALRAYNQLKNRLNGLANE